MNTFIRGCGAALLVGGVLLILTNVILTPLLPTELGDAATRTSETYLLRISVSGVAALLLLFGCVGLHLTQLGASGVFGTVAFIVSFVGNSLLIAIEWANAFVLRAVAQVNAETLGVLDESPLMAIGFASGAAAFALGWLLLLISVLRTRLLPAWQPLSALTGLVLIPLLAATSLGLTGAIIGNGVFGLGLVGLGYSVARTQK